GHVAPEPRVARAIHLAHASRADGSDDAGGSERRARGQWHEGGADYSRGRDRWTHATSFWWRLSPWPPTASRGERLFPAPRTSCWPARAPAIQPRSRRCSSAISHTSTASASGCAATRTT